MPGKEKEAAKFAGENFIRYTGEVVEANEAQVFAWQARCKGSYCISEAICDQSLDRLALRFFMLFDWTIFI